MELEITTLIAAGDHRQALTRMAEAYSAAITRFCAALVGSRDDAEELLQETFIEALRALPRYRAESTVRAWLLGIARRLCIRHLRRRDRRAGLLRRWFRPPEPAAPMAGATGLEARLGLELARLAPNLREAVLLRYQAGLEGADLAAALGVRPDAARKRVSLGIAALRAAMRPELTAAPPTARVLRLTTPTPPGQPAEEDDHGRPDPLSAALGPGGGRA